MSNLTADLDELIGVEDALDFMKRGFFKRDHMLCYKAEFSDKAASEWEVALKFVEQFGTIKKAQNEIERRIEAHR